MKNEISSGGVVVFGNSILLLKKYNGDWVLPKGKVEVNEKLSQTALREVYEEGSVKGEVVKYLGRINYTFRYTRDCNSEIIDKTVHWFLMFTRSMNCTPQKNEGFIDAKFIHINRAAEIAKYDDEKKIIIKAIESIKGN